MFTHLICKLKKQLAIVEVELRNEYGFPIVVNCCQRCGKGIV